MSVEHRQYSPPELLNEPEVRVRSAPAVPVSKFFGGRLQDAKGLSLTQASVSMFKVERPGSASSEYGGIFLSKIDGASLLKFLKAISPMKAKAFDRDAILDDWVMPDLEHEKTLLQRHEKALGRDWETFEKSRKVLMETLFFDPKLQGQKTAGKFANLIGMNYETLKRLAQSALDPTAPTDFQGAFISFIKQRPGIRDKKWVGEESIESTRERVSNWGEWRLGHISESFITAAFCSGDHAIQELVANHCNDTLGDDRDTSLEVVDGKVIVRVGNLLRGEVVFTPTPHGEKIWDFRPETVASANYLIPTIRWEKDGNGERRWILDFLDRRLADNCLQFIDPLPNDIQFDTRRFSPLIGLATIPYFIPSLRKDWPEYQATRNGEAIAVKRGEGGNFMGPAQVLVLAAQRKNDSLTTEFFNSAEEHIEKHT